MDGLGALVIAIIALAFYTIIMFNLFEYWKERHKAKDTIKDKILEIIDNVGYGEEHFSPQEALDKIEELVIR